MPKIVIRHGASYANKGVLPALGSDLAHLTPKGVEQANQMGLDLANDYDVNPRTTTVATSQYNRTIETAQKAGFLNIEQYALLNEVEQGMTPADLRLISRNGRLPEVAIKKALLILEQPPVEDTWIIHGLAFAGLCEVLGVKYDRLIPYYCEPRLLPID